MTVDEWLDLANKLPPNVRAQFRSGLQEACRIRLAEEREQEQIEHIQYLINEITQNRELPNTSKLTETPLEIIELLKKVHQPKRVMLMDKFALAEGLLKHFLYSRIRDIAIFSKLKNETVLQLKVELKQDDIVSKG